MKELSIEQKAKHYDEAIERAKAYQGLRSEMEIIFPELKESEDERIRKELLNHLKEASYGKTLVVSTLDYKIWADWLEKQGETFTKKDVDDAYLKGVCDTKQELEKQSEQKLAFEMITPEESLGIDSDTYNKIVDECIYGEQKPADKIEPKFKQGDIIKEKETGNLFYVNSVEDFGYTLHYKDCIAKGCTMDFKYEDNYELVEQTPTWSEEVQEEQVSEEFINTFGTMLNEGLPDKYLVSKERIRKSAELLFSIARKQLKNEKQEWSEEDEKMLNDILMCGERHCYLDAGNFAWLKSLKERYIWKPSDEQMDMLAKVCSTLHLTSGENETMESIYDALKKLKG